MSNVDYLVFEIASSLIGSCSEEDISFSRALTKSDRIIFLKVIKSVCRLCGIVHMVPLAFLLASGTFFALVTSMETFLGAFTLPTPFLAGAAAFLTAVAWQ